RNCPPMRGDADKTVRIPNALESPGALALAQMQTERMAADDGGTRDIASHEEALSLRGRRALGRDRDLAGRVGEDVSLQLDDRELGHFLHGALDDDLLALEGGGIALDVGDGRDADAQVAAARKERSREREAG